MYLCFLYHYDRKREEISTAQAQKDVEPLAFEQDDTLELDVHLDDDADEVEFGPLSAERDGLIIASPAHVSAKQVSGIKMYFLLGLLGYALGLYVAVCVVAIFQLAQPALIYLGMCRCCGPVGLPAHFTSEADCFA
jgi:Signal peptide peptidase